MLNFFAIKMFPITVTALHFQHSAELVRKSKSEPILKVLALRISVVSSKI